MKVTRRQWLLAGLGVVAIALLIEVAYRPERIGIDFHTYLAASRVGLQQGWSLIYDQGPVAIEQKRLVPGLWTQRYLSPPTVAWLTAALVSLPYDVAYIAWALVTFSALALALAWSSAGQGLNRWIPVVGALGTWWVMHAVNVGQVVPLVAAVVVVAWRLLREKHDVAAGLVLAAILLKPNTAILVPFALLVAGRYRAFSAWSAAATVIVLVALATLGPHGVSAYTSQLSGRLPTGADNLTLHGAFGVDGAAAQVLRLLIVGGVLATAFKLRGRPGLVVPMGVVGSLLVSPYLHASDMCLLAAAGWMVWEERPTVRWRAPIAAGWLLASPYFFLTGLSPRLNWWPLIEIVLLLALVVLAWSPLTRTADLRTRAPA